MSTRLSGLEGKVALVTGAGRMRSIGREIACVLADNGCDVVVTGSGRPPAEYPQEEQAAGWRDVDSVAEEIRALGRRAIAVVCDVSNEAACTALVERTVAELGRIDILVNNAGASRGPDRRPVAELEPAVWRHVLDVNLNGPFYLSRLAAQHMSAQGSGGSILNISSVAGKLLPANHAAYAASKAGLQALTAAMAGELGEARIRVNAICPGIIETSRLDDIPRADGTWERILKGYVPLGRAGRPEEVAWLAAFLCSEQGAWISGQFYTIDGGQVAGR
jgi:NAD(P)-dependent dehydrogenase (short-subunit alcohol dehydrogenase family)